MKKIIKYKILAIIFKIVAFFSLSMAGATPFVFGTGQGWGNVVVLSVITSIVMIFFAKVSDVSVKMEQKKVAKQAGIDV